MTENGTVAYVTKLPECDICKYTGTQSEKESPAVAVADVRTKDGRWANVCSGHLDDNRMYPDYGIGKGQMLVVRVDQSVRG